MRLQHIIARAHPAGNRIDVSWVNPDPATFPGVRVVRREGTHPVGPDDGVLVLHEVGVRAASDLDLKGETAYYYSLFPFHDNPPAVRRRRSQPCLRRCDRAVRFRRADVRVAARRLPPLRRGSSRDV